jgi:Zinc carboxypeptidase/Chitobiase/beta-hexosaminidase C-terminal domain
MSMKAARSALLAVSLFVLVSTGSAVAQTEERGIDPHQGLSLVEVKVSSLNEAMQLQLDAEQYGIEFNEHYRRDNPDGSVTVTVFGTDKAIDDLADAGYDVGVTIEGLRTWEERIDDRQADVRQEKRADAAALEDVGTLSHENELVVLRVDYFENYAGRFLSVEAKTREGGVDDEGDYAGPELSLSYNTGKGTPISSTPRLMAINVDPDTTPNTYIEHRELVRIGEVGTTTPRKPTRIRIGSSTGASIEADVNTWLGGGLPPMHSRYLKDFTTRYMDPTEVYDRFKSLAREFPNISQLIPLPHKTNGYQRRAQALMSGAFGTGATPNTRLGQESAVTLTSRAWGHEGGNDITAEFRNPGAPNSPLTVSMVGNDLVVLLATDSAGALSSTAAQVVNAINANAAASQRLVASQFTRLSAATPPLVAGSGIVQPRARVNLSDFLTTTTNAHVPRGPYEYSVMRIGKKRDGSKTGVFLYCQQHAREWATPLTCLETAEQLLRNYAIDKRTRELVDNLDIFILPSSNPDGSHYSIHNFASQRKNMTNWCNEGGQETDDPFAANFWQPRINPGTGQPYTQIDPAARTTWGTDLNRNNTVGTLFDGYIGASHSCNSEVYTGPSEASEPEIKNEHWVADTFTNIKFSNNIHSFGGYFMWAPGTYLPDRGEGEAVHPNIGVEQYFFLAGDRILNRIKETRNTAILPARTGPIADVLYSAGGNSADEHWYRRGVIAYSFETGADRYFTNFGAIPAGATGIRMGTGTGGFEYLKAGDRITIGAGGPNPETRTITQVVRPNPPNPQPNVIWAEPLVNAHASPTRIEGAALQTGVGFQPDYASEGKFEALEFAAGNYGLLESALEYHNDRKGPKIRMTGPTCSRNPIETTFEFVSEPATIRYTMDGRRPNSSSPLWDSTGPREPGETFHITRDTEFRWIATDIKGNSSTGSEEFDISSRCRDRDDDDDDDDDHGHGHDDDDDDDDDRGRDRDRDRDRD